MTRIQVLPKMYRWALERSGKDIESLPGILPEKLPDWISGDGKPTLKQLEGFARTVHVPFGYLLLSKPPEEGLPISDFRTFKNRPPARPSPNLLDMLYACQRRQDWYREYALVTGQPELPFIGSVEIDSPLEQVAADIRSTLGFKLESREQHQTWAEALRFFIQQADEAGILVMVSSVVLSNTHRKLDLQEFRGFALSDRHAPLVFINGADSKSGQMFTLAHELAHLWANTSGLSNAGAHPLSGFSNVEVWCNAVAAEVLVPLKAFRELFLPDEPVNKAMARLARHFKVSTLVVLRRLLDANWFERRSDFEEAWHEELEHLKSLGSRQGGGDFYRTTVARVSPRFASALISNTLEGQTLYRDAFRLLGIKKAATFDELGRTVGIIR